VTFQVLAVSDDSLFGYQERWDLDDIRAVTTSYEFVPDRVNAKRIATIIFGEFRSIVIR